MLVATSQGVSINEDIDSDKTNILRCKTVKRIK